MAIGSTATLIATYIDGDGDAVLSVDDPAIGILQEPVVITQADPVNPADLPTYLLAPATLTVIDDADATAEATVVHVNFRCLSEGATIFTFDDDDVGGPSESLVLTCAVPASTFVAVSADPNVHLCGGTSSIEADLLDANGDPIAGKDFTFETAVGSIDKTGLRTATLTLAADMATTTITATTIHEGQPFSNDVVVQNTCPAPPAPVLIGVLAAVTADPNVIPCGGSATLTASAQDELGNILTGLAWHWSTDIGLLQVGPPNTADFWDNTATLSIQAGMAADNDALDGYDSATVRAWTAGVDDSGNPVEIAATVTVQQFCLGVNTDYTTAPGLVVLSAAKTSLGCGESTFVGARIRDGKNQVVPDDTVVSLIATDGGFKTDDTTQITVSGSGQASQVGTTPVFEGAPPTGNANRSITTVGQFNGGTTNGSLNATYVAPPFPGDVVITVASGDRYANITLHVACTLPPPVPPVAGMAVPSAGQTACTPIGDGVCIRPPNTGQGQVQIRPPSTGDAGLK